MPEVCKKSSSNAIFRTATYIIVVLSYLNTCAHSKKFSCSQVMVLVTSFSHHDSKRSHEATEGRSPTLPAATKGEIRPIGDIYWCRLWNFQPNCVFCSVYLGSDVQASYSLQTPAWIKIKNNACIQAIVITCFAAQNLPFFRSFIDQHSV